MKCSKEKSLLISAFIEVTFQVLNVLEKKYSEMFDKNPDEIQVIKDYLQNESILSREDYKSDTLNKSVIS